MRAFRWYTLVYVLVMSLLLMKVTSEDSYVMYDDIYRAVIDGYDENVPFEENMYITLNLICPHLQTTSCDVNQGEMGRLQLLSNSSSDVIRIAREFIKKNAHSLNGCCGKCSCGDTCLMNGNCCHSIFSQHKLDNSNLNRPKSRCVPANIKRQALGQNSYFMVSTCLNKTVDIDIVNRCLEPIITIPDEMIPVVSKTTKIVYMNRFCALCNHENNTVRWEAQILFSNPNAIFTVLEMPDTIFDIFKLGGGRVFDIEFIPPAQFHLSYDDYGCISETAMLNTHCNISGKEINISGNEIVNRACASIKVPFTSYRGIAFPNVFCYLCSKNSVIKNTMLCQSSQKVKGSGLYGLLNLKNIERDVDDAADDKNLANLGTERSNNCTCQEIFDQKQSQCRQVYCPYLERYVGCSCIKYINGVAGIEVNAFMQLRPMSKGGLPKKWKDVASAVNKRCRQIGTFTIKHCAGFQGSDRFGDFFYFASSISPKSGFDGMKMLGDVYIQLRNGIALSIDGIAFELSLGEMFKLSKLDLSSQFTLSENEIMPTIKRLLFVDVELSQMFFPRTTLSQLLFCRKILLTDEETEVFTNSTDLIKNGIKTKIGNVYYFQGKTGMKICLSDYIQLFPEPKNNGLPLNNVWKVLLLLCVIVST